MENNNQVLKMEELLNEIISRKVKRVNENHEIDSTLKKRKWYRKYLKIIKSHNGYRHAKKSPRKGEPLQILEFPEKVTIADEWEFCEQKYTDIKILNEAIRNKKTQLKNQFQENSREISQLEYDISDLRKRIAEAKNSLILQVAPSKQIENKNIQNSLNKTNSLDSLIEEHKKRISGKYSVAFFKGYELLLLENSSKDFKKTYIEVMVDALKRFGLFDDNKDSKAQAESAIKMHRNYSDPKNKKKKLEEIIS